MFTEKPPYLVTFPQTYWRTNYYVENVFVNGITGYYGNTVFDAIFGEILPFLAFFFDN